MASKSLEANLTSKAFSCCISYHVPPLHKAAILHHQSLQTQTLQPRLIPSDIFTLVSSLCQVQAPIARDASTSMFGDN